MSDYPDIEVDCEEMSDSMIERVAKAIAGFDYTGSGEFDWEQCTTRDDKSRWMWLAEAAIKAMREPTSDMVGRGGMIAASQRPHGENLTAMYVWSQMIDAALKDARCG